MKGKTQEKIGRGSRKRSSSAGGEKMERVGGRQKKMEGCCSTGQSPQWAVVPMEEEEEEGRIMKPRTLQSFPRGFLPLCQLLFYLHPEKKSRG